MKTRMYFQKWRTLQEYVTTNNIKEWSSGYENGKYFLEWGK